MLRLPSSVTVSSGSTVIDIVWMPIEAAAGTVQLTTTLASPYDGIEGTGSRIEVPSGVMISTSVVGELSKPRFWVGIENDSRSPGSEL